MSVSVMSDSRGWVGRLFHTRGPAAANERSPKRLKDVLILLLKANIKKTDMEPTKLEVLALEFGAHYAKMPCSNSRTVGWALFDRHVLNARRIPGQVWTASGATRVRFCVSQFGHIA